MTLNDYSIALQDAGFSNTVVRSSGLTVSGAGGVSLDVTPGPGESAAALAHRVAKDLAKRHHQLALAHAMAAEAAEAATRRIRDELTEALAGVDGGAS